MNGVFHLAEAVLAITIIHGLFRLMLAHRAQLHWEHVLSNFGGVARCISTPADVCYLPLDTVRLGGMGVVEKTLM